MTERRVIVDTDTATDDALALLVLGLSTRTEIEAVTVVCGNVAFDRQVENAKYALSLASVDAPVYEGERTPLEKSIASAENVHGEGGLGGDLFPETDVPSAAESAVDFLGRLGQESTDGLVLLCLGPLTNVASALSREPGLSEAFEEVWVMGGVRNGLGNVTPAAEFNFYADPDAAKQVLDAMDVTLVDWRLSVDSGALTGTDLEEIAAARDASPLAEFFTQAIQQVRLFNREQRGTDGAIQADALAAILLLAPELIEDDSRYFVDVDEREGLTRGYTLVDELGVTDATPRTRVITEADGERVRAVIRSTLISADPDAVL